MLPLLAALMAGYGLGTFVPTGRSAYFLSLPLSGLVYIATSAFFSSFNESGMEIPASSLLITVTLMQSPVVMLGVFLARRKAKRARYD